MVTLSIIIPVFNCESVITRCLESIDYPNAEIIVINDGSTDSTARTILAYSQKHKNVVLINKDNGGVSSARNAGLECATGKYVMFIDADDYVVPGGITRMIDLADANQADIVKYGVKFMRSSEETDRQSVASVPINIELVKGEAAALYRYDIYDCFVWDSIIRRELLIENHLQFYTDLCLHEDDVFMGQLLSYAKILVVTDLKLYRYVISSNSSSTHNQHTSRQRKLIESSYLATKYRKDHIQKKLPAVLPLERLKYMRWVCSPKTAYKAQLTLKEYKSILSSYKDLGCYPLDYAWIRVARLNESPKQWLKLMAKTFLCNHPSIAYWLIKMADKKKTLFEKSNNNHTEESFNRSLNTHFSSIKRALILGNGADLDIHHGVKSIKTGEDYLLSTYSNYAKYYFQENGEKKYSHPRSKLNQWLVDRFSEAEEWYNLEQEIALFASCIDVKSLDMLAEKEYFEHLRETCGKLFYTYTWSTPQEYADDPRMPNIDVNRNSEVFKILGFIVNHEYVQNIYSFNYSDLDLVFDKITNNDEDLLHSYEAIKKEYIHLRDHKVAPIIGVASDENIPPELSFYKKTHQQESSIKRIIQSWENMDDLIIIGHSMSRSDFDYFRPLLQSIDSNASRVKKLVIITKDLYSQSDIINNIESMLGKSINESNINFQFLYTSKESSNSSIITELINATSH